MRVRDVGMWGWEGRGAGELGIRGDLGSLLYASDVLLPMPQHSNAFNHDGTFHIGTLSMAEMAISHFEEDGHIGWP